VIKKKNISQEDINIWQNYTKNPTDIHDKENNQNKNNSIYDRYIFDLHGYTLLDANIKVKEIVLSCIKKRYREILFITGKGIHSNSDEDVYASKDFSKLKNSVPDYIKSDLNLSKYVSSVSQADIEDGGDGAIIVKLKKL
tara:strand:+ start:7627 stop:8046 length:420 start_codon:yes stop_codon:yes gene_type:complete